MDDRSFRLGDHGRYPPITSTASTARIGNKLNLTENKNHRIQLYQADWKIWFLGGGLGGALGLCILAVALTINASSAVPSVATVVLGAVHSVFLVGFWVARFKTEFRLAWWITMAVSSVCTLLLAFALQYYSSVPLGAGSLFTLSFMQAVFAITLPLHYNPLHLDADGG